MLAFTALTMSIEQREQALQASDFEKSDGKLDRFEFMDICVNLLWDKDLPQLESAATSYAEFRAALKRRINTRWRRIADKVDRAARFWVPFVYVTLLTTLMSLTLDDTYSQVMRTNNGSDGQFSKQIGAWPPLDLWLISTCLLIEVAC